MLINLIQLEIPLTGATVKGGNGKRKWEKVVTRIYVTELMHMRAFCLLYFLGCESLVKLWILLNQVIQHSLQSFQLYIGAKRMDFAKVSTCILPRSHGLINLCVCRDTVVVHHLYFQVATLTAQWIRRLNYLPTNLWPSIWENTGSWSVTSSVCAKTNGST